MLVSEKSIRITHAPQQAYEGLPLGKAYKRDIRLVSLCKGVLM